MVLEFFTNNFEKSKIGEIRNCGKYCHQCGITLCIGGTVNLLKNKPLFYDECPSCHQEKKESENMFVFKMNKYDNIIYSNKNFNNTFIDNNGNIYNCESMRKIINKCIIVLQCFEI